jgi:hypothetical protein
MIARFSTAAEDRGARRWQTALDLVVAQETGFADRERMRRAFLRTFGVPAEALRRNARQGPVAVT